MRRWSHRCRRVSRPTWATTRSSPTPKCRLTLKARIGFTPDEEKLLVNPDLDFIAKRAAELKDFWDKEFKRA